MSSPTIQAALDWAARMQRGEVEYNSYIAALADELTRLREENVRFRELLGIHTDESADAWDEVVVALRTARQRVARLEAGLREVVRERELVGEGRLELGLVRYRLVYETAVSDLEGAIVEARALLEVQT